MKQNETSDSDENQKESTTLVGIVAEEGVVIAADKQISGDVKQKGTKLFKIHPNCIIATSGLLTDCQRTANKVTKQIKKHEMKRGRHMSVQNALDVSKNIAEEPLWTSSLFAAYDNNDKIMTQFGILGSDIPTNKFDTAGSGNALAKGTIEAQYEEGLSIDKAKEIAINALKTANKHGVYTGVGIDVGIIDQDGARIEKNVVKLE